MAEPLSGADRSALAAEQGPVNMSVGGVLVLSAGATLTRAAVIERIRERLHLAPRLRQRLAEGALGLANPVWVDDRDFDLDWHVRHAVLPPPGGEQELGTFVGVEMSRRLERTRPLWELTLVDGLEGGRTAVVAKIHHALVDGLAAIALGMVLLDPTPEPLAVPPADGDWQPRPYALRQHLLALAREPLSQAQRVAFEALARTLAPDPRRAAGDLRRATELLTQLARTRPDAPMTPLNESISPNRRYALVRGDLASVKTAAKAAGGTVNDAILAAVSGMLAHYLEVAGVERSQRPPVALVPVSVRRDAEQGELGNRISTVLVDLPVELDDAGERIAAIGARMRALKDSPAVRAGALIVGMAGAAPPVVSSMLARAMSGVRAFNLVVSNIAGPQQPLYLAAEPVLEIYPVVPLNPGNQGLAVGVISYDGNVCFGLLADRDLDPPLGVAREGLERALATLRG